MKQSIADRASLFSCFQGEKLINGCESRKKIQYIHTRFQKRYTFIHYLINDNSKCKISIWYESQPTVLNPLRSQTAKKKYVLIVIERRRQQIKRARFVLCIQLL